MYEVKSGVPQGLPMSPFLSILGLREYLSQQDCVNYADDQVHPFEIKDLPERGIVHALEKCGWIKYEDRWTEKGLKFIGFSVTENNFDYKIRKGTSEEVNREIKDLFDGKL